MGIEVVAELLDGVSVEIIGLQTEAEQFGRQSIAVRHRHASIRTIRYFLALERRPRTVEAGMPSSSAISS